MTRNIEITGGAGPEVTAAIAAVVGAIEIEELAAQAVRPQPIHQSQWIRRGRSPKHAAPTQSRDDHSPSTPPAHT